MDTLLKDICQYRNSKVDLNDIDFETYVSTENMLPNKQGVCISKSCPEIGNVNVYKEGDTLISNIRPYFKKIYLAKNSGGCSADVLVFSPINGTDKLFLYYLLSQDEFFNYVMLGSKGCKMPRGDKKHIMEWSIPDFDLYKQQQIADILSSLDAKIETNNKLNEKLEEMAQAIFKSWFVDFEPFKNQPFHETELGMIPEGWEVINIDCVYDIKYGNNLPTSEIKEKGQYPVYGANGVIGYFNTFNCNGYSVLITSRGNGSGDVYRTHSSKSFVTNNSFIVKTRTNYTWIELSYIYYSFLNINFKSYTNGSAQPQLTNKSIHNIDIVLPSKKDIENFCDITMSIINNIESLMKENARLASLRDTLLPRLMSGEIKI